MTFNGKRWIGHDLEVPLENIAKGGGVDGKVGLTLPDKPDKPKACLKCLKRTRSPEEDDPSDGDDKSNQGGSGKETTVEETNP